MSLSSELLLELRLFVATKLLASEFIEFSRLVNETLNLLTQLYFQRKKLYVLRCFASVVRLSYILW